jgi:hypothetical protein
MLDIKRKHHNTLEGSLTFNWMGQERYFAMSASDFDQMPSLLAKYTSKLAEGAEGHYTKVINQAQVSIMFPVAMGMPFIYKYKEPAVLHAATKMGASKDLSVNETKYFKIETEIQLTYARNLDGSVGFMDTLTNEYAKVGVVSKIQIQLPFKLQLEKKQDNFEIAFEPQRPEHDETLLHYSVWPYSSIQKRDSLVTVSHDTNTKVISRRQKTASIDTKFGQSFGFVCQIQGYSYSSDYENYGKFFESKSLLNNLANIMYQRDIALTHFNFKHLGKQSQNKRVAFTFAYGKFFIELLNNNTIKSLD